MGVIKIYDSRAGTEEPQNSLQISCQNEKSSNCVNCISYHPTQNHIVLGGSEEGSITVWDLRKPNYPASYFTAHKLGITELAFHKSQTNKVLTASESGELWLWNQNNPPQMHTMDTESQVSTSGGGDIDPWLNGELANTKFNVTALIDDIKKPISSFDIVNSKVICACDNEAIYLIDNVY